MTEAGWALLQRHLLTRYAEIKQRLTRYLGSADLASEALHETWLRLQRGGELAGVRNADAYLYSMAINMAANHRRSEKRRLTTQEVDALLEIEDDAPDAGRTLEARRELQALMSIIGELPVRQQAILLAARLEGTPRRDIAARFGISERLVQRDLQQAHDYCATRFEKIMSARFRSVPRDVSMEQGSVKPGEKKPARPGTDDR